MSTARPLSFSLYLANARGILAENQLSELQTLLSSPLNLIALTETHVDSTVPDAAFSAPDWCLLRRDRSRHGGGVALLSKSALHCSLRSDLNSPHGEDLWADVLIAGRKMTVGVVYRPPHQSSLESEEFFSDLEHSIDLALRSNTILVLLGDFNAKSSEWLPSSVSDSAGSTLFALLESFGLTQLVEDVTRPPGGQGLPGPDANAGSLLDLMITNCPDLFHPPTVGPPLGLSDHYSVNASLNLKTEPPLVPFRRLWNLQKGDVPGFLADLSRQPWPAAHSSDSMDSQWSQWSSSFMSCATRHIPSKVVRRVTPKPPWLSDVLLAECKLKRSLFRLCKLNPSPLNLSNFRQQRNKVTALLRRAKKSFSAKLEQQIGSSGGGHHFWSFVRRCKGRSSSRPLPPLICCDGSLASSDFDKANTLNQFFVKQSDLPGRNDAPTEACSYSSPCSSALSTVSVSTMEVFNCLSGLNVSKAPGLDNIPNLLLRVAAPAICSPLAVLFQNSLNSGQLPLAWKVGKVKAIFKRRGRADQPDNYRPITLLSCVCKVLERIVNRQLFAHLSSNDLLSPAQSGFRRGDSAPLQLFRLSESLISSVDSGQVVAGVFYDFRKAFDTVWHAALLAKLRQAGVCGSLLRWFEDFLSDRVQYVEVGSTLSLPASPLAGVPQGSVLSPTLFLLFVNSVLSVTSCQSNCFADDTCTLVFSSSAALAQSSLQLEVDAVSRWARAHKLSFHPTKSVTMLFHHPRLPPPPLVVYLNGAPLSQVPVHKHLGVFLSSGLSWSSHVDHLVKSASSMLALLRLFRFSFRFSPRSLLRIYIQYIRPVLEYGSVAWCGLSSSSALRLEALQRKALAISGFPPDLLPSLSSRRSAALSRLFSRILSNDVPDHLVGFCSWPRVASSRPGLRNSSSVRLPRPRTNLLLSSPLYLAASAFNQSS